MIYLKIKKITEDDGVVLKEAKNVLNTSDTLFFFNINSCSCNVMYICVHFSSY